MNPISIAATKAHRANLRYFAQTSGRLLSVTPRGFLSPQEQQDIPRVTEVARKYGTEVLPPPGA